MLFPAYKLLSLSVIFLTLSACQVINMVDVKQVNFEQNMAQERQSILTNQKLSQSSKNILLAIHPNLETCVQSPASCMNELNQIAEIHDEDKLATGSELYLAHALFLKQRASCHTAIQQKQARTPQEKQCIDDYLESLNQSIRYSYAYLFASSRQPQQRIFNNRQIQVKDFYNQAIIELVNISNNIEKDDGYLNQALNIGQSLYHLHIKNYPNLHLKHIDYFIPSNQLTFTNLNAISRRDGFGAEFVLKLKTNKTQPTVVNYAEEKIDIFNHQNIHQAEYLPATIVIEPKHKDNIQEILHSKEMNFILLDPKLNHSVNIAGHDLQLAGNFSAPYGLWLAHEKFGSQGLNTLLIADKQFVSPRLFMFEPYDPKKKIIIMLHGLASSPEAWISVSNDLMNDAILRENYQIWQVFYSTNLPILENRYQIYHLLQQSLAQIQQKHPQHAIQDTLLIGHSMGGVISRLLLSEDDFNESAKIYLQQHCDICQTHQLNINQLVDDIRPQLTMQPLPSVSRAIFISAPFKGTIYADRWFTKMARKAIKLPSNMVNHGQQRLDKYLMQTKQDQEKLQLLTELYQNGASDLSPKSMFMALTQNTKITRDLPYHLIIGNDTKFDTADKMTDGIVPYSSIYLPDAHSIKVIKGSHSIQYHPEAVLELRRILYLHLQESQKNQ